MSFGKNRNHLASFKISQQEEYSLKKEEEIDTKYKSIDEMLYNGQLLTGKLKQI